MKFNTYLLALFSILSPTAALTDTGSYYAWAVASDGTHCYEYASTGAILNGTSVDDDLCGGIYYSWEAASDGTHCYEYAPDGSSLNGGYSVDNAYCGG